MSEELDPKKYFEKILGELEKNPTNPVDLDSCFFRAAPSEDQVVPAPVQHHEEKKYEEPPKIISNPQQKQVLGSMMEWINPKYWLCGCPVPITQHYANTKEALQSLFPSSVISFLAQASRLPDFTHFHDHRAHAQSRNDKNGCLVDENQDYQDFLGYVVDLLKQMQTHLNQSHIGDALWNLGYILHALQDLAVHQGQSNAEHSYNNWVGKCPDTDMERAKLAIKISRVFVKEYLLGSLRNKLCSQSQVWDALRLGEKCPSLVVYGTTLLGSVGDIPGALKFRFCEYRAYEAKLNDDIPVEKLDARWSPFTAKNPIPEMMEIKKYFLDPIAQHFLQS